MKKTAGALICIIFLFSLVLVPFANADWIMFRSDPSHDGVGIGNPQPYPTLVWKYLTANSVYSSPAVVNGVVYIGSEDGNVYALDATSGIQLWKYTTGDDVFSSPAVFNGVVYIASFDGNVYALNATNGVKLWNYNTSDWVWASPAVLNGVVYIASFNRNIYALNATNGDKLWNYTTSGYVDSSPAVVNGVVYVGSDDGNVYALNATNGVPLWCYATNGEVHSSPAVVGGVVCVGSDDGNVYALNATSGNQLWSYFAGDPVDSSPAIVNDVVYILSGNGYVYALNAANGAELWSYNIGNVDTFRDEFTSSPAVVDNVIYIGSDDDNVYALNATSGTKLWSYPTGGMVESSPAVVNGIVYVGSDDDNVYAFGGSSTPTQIPTPFPTPTPPPKPIGIVTGISMSIKQSFIQYTYVNQPVEITANPTSGNPPYIYQWDTQLWTSVGGSPEGPIVAFPGATSSTFTFVESTPGTYDISLNISDSAGYGDYDSFPISGVWVIVSASATVPATTENGATVDLILGGNVTISQMSNVTITTNQSDKTTTVSFTVTGQSGTTGFGNITIPISAVTYGTSPTIYIDDQLAQNQGYTQDSNNYYVWYTTSFSTHQISIVFTTTPNSTPVSHSPTPQSSLLQEAIYGVVTGVVIAAIVTVGLYLYLGKARKPKTEVHLEIFDATGLLVSFKKRIQVKLGGHG